MEANAGANGDQAMSGKIVIPGWERLRFWKKRGLMPTRIIDIGAHRGEWSTMAHVVWPGAKIAMIEANEEARINLAELSAVGEYEIALLGEGEVERVNFYCSFGEFNTGNSRYREQTSFFSDCEVRELPMTTLDKVVRRRGWGEATLLKIDVQGSELAVLEGAKETLNTTEVIIMEVQNLEYNEGAPKMAEVIARMDRYGYLVLDVLELHYLPSGELFQTDLMWVRSDSALIKKGTLYSQ